jgi:hypothetical protein
MSIKWLFTFFMFVGAIFISFQIDWLIGSSFLFVGNLCWILRFISIKDYAAASVFIIMAATWLSGLIKYFFF